MSHCARKKADGVITKGPYAGTHWMTCVIDEMPDNDKPIRGWRAKFALDDYFDFYEEVEDIADHLHLPEVRCGSGGYRIDVKPAAVHEEVQESEVRLALCGEAGGCCADPVCAAGT